jgi:hypothetical protein
MNLNKILIILILSLGFSVTVSACGLWDKIQKTASNATSKKTEPEVAKPDNSVINESDNPLLFMETLTGYKNIIQVNEIIDFEKTRGMLKIANSCEPDSIGRRYFTYSVPLLRQAPVSMPQRRFDIESCMANVASELKLAYDVDIIMIARRVDKMITYVVDIGENDNYGYGVFYIISAVVIPN